MPVSAGLMRIIFMSLPVRPHNSPSNMEAYGGAITGIVGVYRDPLGTGLGSKLIMGSYGFCVGDRDYEGDLKPKLHPRRLLDGVIEGVRTVVIKRNSDRVRSGDLSSGLYGQMPGLCHGFGDHAGFG